MRLFITILGILMLLAGIVFALQGAGYLQGSSMTGSSFWLYAGSVIAILGLIVLALGLRGGSKKMTGMPPTS